MRTREAVLPDAEQIHALIAAYSGDGTLLPRSLADSEKIIRRHNFGVAFGVGGYASGPMMLVARMH